MKNERHLIKSIYKIPAAFLIIFTIQIVWLPEGAFAQEVNPSPSKMKDSKRNDLFGELFVEGRNLIDKGEWARAAAKFREAMEKNPDHQLTDAALYWLAFCNKKQKKYEEADVALNLLLQNFPSSSWTSDAEVMKMEILSFLDARDADSRNPSVNNPGDLPPPGQTNTDVRVKVKNSDQNTVLTDVDKTDDRMPLDRADEIRLAAFQSLLNADPKRAIAVMGDVFKPDSRSSESFKRVILRVWRNPRLFASRELVDNIAKNGGEREFMTLLRERLRNIFESEKNSGLRQDIISTLVHFADAQTIEYLKKLYAAENDRELKKAIINAFGNAATFAPADVKGDQRMLAQLDAAREERRKTGQTFLLEIVRTEKDVELRRLAFSNLTRFPNWLVNDEGVDTTIAVYDAETDEQLKLSIIRIFAKSKQNKAVRKLLDIAKNEKNDRLRLEAIYSLGTSKDPEVIKFLEELIK